MKTFLNLLLLSSLSVTQASEHWWKVNGPPTTGNYAGGNTPEDATDALTKFLQQKEWTEWETYEDELVKIQYPKHPLLELEVRKNNTSIRVEGGVCTTVDNSFQNAYYLTADGATYGVFLLQASDWFDDGVCFCGPMVHHVKRIENSNIVRFSLLPGGAVKKAQILGDKLRLMAFEWTHLACPREVYEEMVERMELKIKSKHTPATLSSELEKRYNFDGPTRLIHVGMTPEQTISLLGKPVKKTAEEITWHGVSNDYRVSFTTVFKENRLTHIKDNSIRALSDTAIEGTLTWATDLLEEAQEQDPPTTIAPATLDKISEISLAAIHPDPSQSWRALHLLELLAENHNHSNPQIKQLILENKLPTDSLGLRIVNAYCDLKAINIKQKETWIIQAIQDLAPINAFKAKGSAFSSGYTEKSSLMNDLLTSLSQSNQKATKIWAKKLANANNPSWYPILLEEQHDLFNEKEITTLTLKALKHGKKLENGSLIYAAFETIPKLKLNATQHKEISDLLDALPDGQKESDWHKALMKAKQSLAPPSTT
ncbi:hypothetical protein [Rubritalea tangerina]|uniref:HEAT repeat domain-containing protein n=1 Tax=Rubritalea tangerina TaxID=430798 RepID=A0ABW4Z6L3_9BACT